MSKVETVIDHNQINKPPPPPQAKKVRFLTWECQIKIPGKPNIYRPVRAWTKKGAEAKATKKQARLLGEYIMESSAPLERDSIVTKIPDIPDNPNRLDTDAYEEYVSRRGAVEVRPIVVNSQEKIKRLREDVEE